MTRSTPELFFYLVERSNEFHKKQELEVMKLNFLNWLPECKMRELQLAQVLNKKCKSFGDNKYLTFLVLHKGPNSC